MMLKPIDVSVVVCAYTSDRWQELSAAVDSLVAQGEQPREIIVVTDHSGLLHKRCLRRFADVAKVLANDELPGLSGARNTGVRAAGGDVVAFLDDDAVAAPDWLAELTAAYDDGVAGVGGSSVPVWPRERPTWHPPEFGWVVGCSYRGLPVEPAPVRNLIGCNMSMRRELFDAVGGFTHGIGRIGTIPLGCEETEWCIRVRQRFPELEFLYAPRAVVQHRVASGRDRWQYFMRRCWAEGRSKARVSQLVGAGDALRSEKTYARRVLPQGIVDGLTGGVQGDTAGFARAAAIAAGVSITGAGYLRERLIDIRPRQSVGATRTG